MIKRKYQPVKESITLTYIQSIHLSDWGDNRIAIDIGFYTIVLPYTSYQIES
jgi:hypothetical protein